MDNYFAFCRSFDMAFEGEISISDLEKDAEKYDINFDDFCDANDFVNSENWAECIKEYGEQIESGERA